MSLLNARIVREHKIIDEFPHSIIIVVMEGQVHVLDTLEETTEVFHSLDEYKQSYALASTDFESIFVKVTDKEIYKAYESHTGKPIEEVYVWEIGW